MQYIKIFRQNTKMSFRCESCSRNFKRQKYLDAHLKSKIHLGMQEENKKFICPCGKQYFHRQSLYAHRKKCNIEDTDSNSEQYLSNRVKEIQQVLIDQQSKYEKEREEMRAQIALLLERNAGNGTTTNTTTNTTNIDTQNNTINIHINAFGKENVEYLDDKTIAACIERVYKSIPAILEKIHFDPKHPENHNIKITNKKLPYATIMGDNQKWKTVDRKSAIETMVYNGYNLLDEKYPDVKPLIPDSKQSHFEGFQEKFFDDDNKQLNKQLKNDVELLVLNQ